MAPTRAASSRTDSASKGSTQCRNRLVPVAWVEPPPAPRSIQALRKASATSVTRVPALASATARATQRLPESASGERPIGALVSISPNSTSTTTEPR